MVTEAVCGGTGDGLGKYASIDGDLPSATRSTGDAKAEGIDASKEGVVDDVVVDDVVADDVGEAVVADDACWPDDNGRNAHASTGVEVSENQRRTTPLYCDHKECLVDSDGVAIF